MDIYKKQETNKQSKIVNNVNDNDMKHQWLLSLYVLRPNLDRAGQ